MRCPKVIGQNLLSKFKSMSTISTSDILFNTVNNAGLITLNRPNHLNALNANMTLKIIPKLLQWENERAVVIIKGSGERAFCAGGDIVKMNQAGLKALDFVGPVFIMNALIGRYKIPYVALIDGVTMGTGVGLSVHGAYRIATERTAFAMPEVKIGFFPDCGSSYFLSRLRGNLGVYLGLTGSTLKGADVLHAGLATHFVHSCKLDELESQLLYCNSKSDVDEVLSKATRSLDLPKFSLNPVLRKIDQCFGGKTVEDIVDNLMADGSIWAQGILKIMSKVCPTSLKVTHQQLDFGKTMNLEECLYMEYQLVKKFLEREDFHEVFARRFDVTIENTPADLLKCLANGTSLGGNKFQKCKVDIGCRKRRTLHWFYNNGSKRPSPIGYSMCRPSAIDLLAKRVRALLIDKDQKPKWKPSTLAEVTDEIVKSFFLNLSIGEELVRHKL